MTFFIPVHLELITMDRRINHLKKKLLENLKYQWTLREMADEVNISTSHLLKIFKSDVGISPVQFIKHLRLEKARELMINTFLRVQQISFEVGIADQCYFAREFKKKYGLTSSEFRNQFCEILDDNKTEINK